MQNRTVNIFMHGVLAGVLQEKKTESNLGNNTYTFRYLENYKGPPVSLLLPVNSEPIEFLGFPPFLDGLLPEGIMLEALLKQRKIDHKDYLSQLLAVGSDLVGAITVSELL